MSRTILEFDKKNGHRIKSDSHFLLLSEPRRCKERKVFFQLGSQLKKEPPPFGEKHYSAEATLGGFICCSLLSGLFFSLRESAKSLARLSLPATAAVDVLFFVVLDS